MSTSNTESEVSIVIHTDYTAEVGNCAFCVGCEYRTRNEEDGLIRYDCDEWYENGCDYFDEMEDERGE